MEKYPLKIIIAGHVDHGKSTLIGRILLATHSLPAEKIAEIQKISRELGKDTEIAYISDQLKEERENNLTIDTTQAFFKTRKRKYVIIDAPGHVEFIKNMISGATLAQTGILIVDAKEGIQEQTKRHAYLFHLLGLEKWIVAINKMDMVNYEESCFNSIKSHLLEFFARIPASPYAVVPVSARAGENIIQKSSYMKWYKQGSLLSILDGIAMESKKKEECLRLPIQDIYESSGEKMLVGRISYGTIRKGQKILLLPDRLEATVKEVKIFQKKVKMAREKENIGLILKEDLPWKRGQILVQKENAPEARCSFQGNLFWLSDRPLVLNKPFMLRCATQEIESTSVKIKERRNSSTLDLLEEEASSLQKNETGIVYFQTKEPVLVEKFSQIPELGRFIIEDNFAIEGTGIVCE